MSAGFNELQSPVFNSALQQHLLGLSPVLNVARNRDDAAHQNELSQISPMLNPNLPVDHVPPIEILGESRGRVVRQLEINRSVSPEFTPRANISQEAERLQSAFQDVHDEESKVAPTSSSFVRVASFRPTNHLAEGISQRGLTVFSMLNAGDDQ